MTASTVTGRGPGAANTVNNVQLSILANGPAIMYSGRASIVNVEDTSPPLTGVVITLPRPLTGSQTNYVVTVTPTSDVNVCVTTMNDNDDGDFFSFVIQGDDETDVMFMVSQVGMRPAV